jgi:hypothetical protein
VIGREAMARHFPAELDRTLDLLTRRELIEPADGGYCFQVELFRVSGGVVKNLFKQGGTEWQ